MTSLCGLSAFTLMALLATPLTPQSDSPLKPYKKAFAWFDTLGFPDLKDTPFIRVSTGRWSQSGSKDPVNSYTYGFLLKEDGDSFQVFTLNLFTSTLQRTGPDTPDHQRVAFEKVELADHVRKRLAALRAFKDSEEEDAWRRFGELLAERAELFVLARGAARKGKTEEARQVADYAAAMPDRSTGKPPVGGLQEAVSSEIAHSMMWRAVLMFGDRSNTRSQLLERFQWIVRHFPESEHAQRARVTSELLTKMIKEDEAHAGQKQKPFDKMSVKERVAELIYQLRDQNGHQWSQPGSCDIFLDDRKDQSAAHQLVKIGYQAIPQLLEVVDDKRFTRSVGFHRNFYFSHHVLRVGDCALAIISRISGRSFYERTYTNAAMVKDGLALSTKDRIKKWWKEFEKKGEKVMFLEATEKGNGQQAKRLVEKYAASAFPALVKGIKVERDPWHRTTFINLIARLKEEPALTFLREELRKGPFA